VHDTLVFISLPSSAQCVCHSTPLSPWSLFRKIAPAASRRRLTTSHMCGVRRGAKIIPRGRRFKVFLTRDLWQPCRRGERGSKPASPWRRYRYYVLASQRPDNNIRLLSKILFPKTDCFSFCTFVVYTFNTILPVPGLFSLSK